MRPDLTSGRPDIQVVRHMGHALLGNAFHSLFETDLGSLVCGLKRVIDRFLKKSPQMPFWALFRPGGQKRGSKRGKNCYMCLK